VPLRRNFNQTLDEIRSEVVRMGNRASEMVRQAVEATVSDDHNLARRVVDADDEVDHLERLAVEKTILTLLKEAPVAQDLRFLISTLGVVSEIEKTADKAVKLSRRSMKLSGRFPGEMKVALQTLGEMSRRAFSNALRLYMDFDPELADEVVRSDKAIDTAYSEARSQLVELIQKDPASADHYVRTMDAFHTLEHVADHAVAIAVSVRMIYAPRQDSTAFVTPSED
jgi:phosphate transport system protein